MSTSGSVVVRLLLAAVACLGLAGMAGAQTKPALVHSVDVALPPPVFVSLPQYVTAGTTSVYVARVVGSSKTNSISCEIVNNGTIINASNGVLTFTVGPLPEPVVFSCSQSDGTNISAPGFTTTNAVFPVQSPVISAPQSVLAGTMGLTASVAASPNCTYTWSIANGTITGPAGSQGITAYGNNTITFNAGSIPSGQSSGITALTVTVAGPDASVATAGPVNIVLN